MLTLAQFELRELPIPALEPDQALVRVKLMNIHSATRSRMASGMTPLGETDRTNYACAEVMRSRDPTFKEGDVIACQAGWRDYQVISSQDESVGYGPASDRVRALNATRSQWTYVFRPRMVAMWPSDVLMEMFGSSGMTAYFGMRECGPLMPGEAVLVAGATGSVGSIVAQLAKSAGCYVVGFAGGPERCRWVLETLGIDGCIDYRAPDLDQQLVAAFPDGVDVYSDGIGGSLTETVSRIMNQKSRLFAFGGAAALYTDRPSQHAGGRGLRRTFGISEAVEQIIEARNIHVEAWIVHDFYHDRIEAEDALSRMMQDGVLKPINTVVEGFENLPAAVVSLYAAGPAGKLQVRFA